MARREAWKTFTVRITEVRGQAQITALVSLSDVAGVDGRPYQERPIWSGIVSRRAPGQSITPEEGAELAAHALRSAYPGLF